MRKAGLTLYLSTGVTSFELAFPARDNSAWWKSYDFGAGVRWSILRVFTVIRMRRSTTTNVFTLAPRRPA